MVLNREDYERFIRNREAETEKNKKFGEAFGKHMLTVLAVLMVIICLIPVKFGIKILLWLFAILLTFIIFPCVMTTMIYFNQLKRMSPGILSKLRYGTKYRKDIVRFRDDLCSDEILAHVNSLLENEKNHFSRIALLDQKRFIHHLRCEHDEALNCVELMKLENEKCGGKFPETVLMSELSSYGTVEDMKKFSAAFAGNEAVIEDMLEREAVLPTAVGVLLTDYELYRKNYEKALEHCLLTIEYREKIRIHIYGENKSLDNAYIFSASASHSCAARVYAFMGDIENAQKQLKAAKKTADNLTCEIPMLLAEEFAKAETEISLKKQETSSDLQHTI